jgi:heparan-alpha-glucosaminide N-acetyltransferase
LRGRKRHPAINRRKSFIVNRSKAMVPTASGSEPTRGNSKPDRVVSSDRAGLSARLVSLDAYRGLTMVLMASSGMGLGHLRNDPTWGWLAKQGDHCPWQGCTLWDLIFPSFLFIIGVAMPYSFRRRRERGDSWTVQFLHALKRCLVLFALGVFLDSYQVGTLHVNFPVVLQQIAVCYLLAFLLLPLPPLGQGAIGLVLLAGSAAAFLLYGGDAGDPWARDQNHGTWVDRWLHLPSTNGNVSLNALPATVSVLLGVICGEMLQTSWSPARKVLIMAGAGLGGLLLGWLVSGAVPIIKWLWTSSYVLWTGGWAYLIMLVFYGVVDVLHFRRWAFPLVVVGMNAIAVYVLEQAFTPEIQRAINVFFGVGLSGLPIAGPVILSTLTLFVLWCCAYWLYRHRIFFKV